MASDTRGATGATIAITKMHGVGNDYVYVDCRERDGSEKIFRVVHAPMRTRSQDQ